MKNIMTIVAGMGVLIGIFLFLNNWQASRAVIQAIADGTTGTIKTLQARD